MISYDKQYFIGRFSSLQTEELLQSLLVKELCDEAVVAIDEILQSRGVVGHALELQKQGAIKAFFRKSSATNQCDFCGRSRNPLWNWTRDGAQKFCGKQCFERARLMEASVDIPLDVVLDHAASMRFGPCPVCAKVGSTVEMRHAHYVFSVVLFAYHESSHVLACRRCGIKRNVLAAISCFLLGWWSLAGLFSTPVQIYRNVRLAKSPDVDVPSKDLISQARMDLAVNFRKLDLGHEIRGIVGGRPRSGGASAAVER